MALHEKLEAVQGPDTFLEFVRALLADRVAEAEQPADPCGRGANGWENHTIEEFLGAALRWAEDSGFGDEDLKEGSPWKQAASFLYCGKIYE